MTLHCHNCKRTTDTIYTRNPLARRCRICQTEIDLSRITGEEIRFLLQSGDDTATDFVEELLATTDNPALLRQFIDLWQRRLKELDRLALLAPIFLGTSAVGILVGLAWTLIGQGPVWGSPIIGIALAAMSLVPAIAWIRDHGRAKEMRSAIEELQPRLCNRWHSPISLPILGRFIVLDGLTGKAHKRFLELAPDITQTDADRYDRSDWEVFTKLLRWYQQYDDVLTSCLINLLGQSGHEPAIPILAAVARQAKDDQIAAAAEQAFFQIKARLSNASLLRSSTDPSADKDTLLRKPAVDESTLDLLRPAE
jgi:hypothetical protein